jgi:hypothetical protein
MFGQFDSKGSLLLALIYRRELLVRELGRVGGHFICRFDL